MSVLPGQGLLAALEQRRTELRRFLIARTGSEADAEDLLSELWIKVSSSRSGPVANPSSYLFRMANNLALDRIREAKRRQRREQDWSDDQLGSETRSGESADPSADAEQMLINEDEARRLGEAIGKLPPGAQRVLRMHKLEGLAHAEIAEQLGISKSAVEKHMAVAMNHLRRLLGG